MTTATTARCYGTFQYRPSPDGRRGHWAIDARADIAIRIKRLFVGINQARTGTLLVSDTPETSYDLEWILQRWPMTPADQSSQRRLTQRAQGFRETDDLVAKMLAGYTPPPGEGRREPAVAPYPYQEVVPRLVAATGRLLCCDPLGSGKTAEALLLLCDPKALPAVVVTMTQLPKQWQRQAAKFTPWLNCYVATSGKPHLFAPENGQQELPFGVDMATAPTGIPDVFILNYTKLDGWRDYLAGFVTTVIFDEAQELRTGAGTNKWSAARQIADAATYKLGLTSTPVFNYGNEIFNIMEVLAPGELGEEAEFRREWCTTGSNGKLKVTDPAALGTALRGKGLLLRRTHADTGRSPGDEPIRVEQPVDTDPAVLKRLTGDVTAMARLVLDTTADRTERWRASGELDLRLRHATGVAKAPFVAEYARFLLDSVDKLILFGWHHDVYDIWLNRLSGFNPVRFTGTETTRMRDQSIERFITGDSRVLVMSLRAGVGVDGLQGVCHTVLFGELDWSPAVIEQNIGRVWRDGQTQPVMAHFALADEGADPPMCEVLGIKRRQSDPILNPDAALFLPGQSEAPLDKVKMLAMQTLQRAGIEVPALRRIDTDRLDRLATGS